MDSDALYSIFVFKVRSENDVLPSSFFSDAEVLKFSVNEKDLILRSSLKVSQTYHLVTR